MSAWAAELSQLPQTGEIPVTDPELFERVVFFFSGVNVGMILIGDVFVLQSSQIIATFKHLFFWEPPNGYTWFSKGNGTP